LGLRSANGYHAEPETSRSAPCPDLRARKRKSSSTLPADNRAAGEELARAEEQLPSWSACAPVLVPGKRPSRGEEGGVRGVIAGSWQLNRCRCLGLAFVLRRCGRQWSASWAPQLVANRIDARSKKNQGIPAQPKPSYRFRRARRGMQHSATQAPAQAAPHDARRRAAPSPELTQFQYDRRDLATLGRHRADSG